MGGTLRAVLVAAVLGFSAGQALAGPKAYVSSTGDDTVIVVDTDTGQALGDPIAVGSEPFSSVASPDGSRLYVACRGSNSVTVIDTATDTVVDSFPVKSGGGPTGIAITPDGGRLYVSLTNTDEISVVSVATGTEIAVIDLGEDGDGPQGIAITPDGTKAYVALNTSDRLGVIDLTTNLPNLPHLAVASDPREVAVSADGTRAVVVGDGLDSVNTATDLIVHSIAPGDVLGEFEDIARAGPVFMVSASIDNKGPRGSYVTSFDPAAGTLGDVPSRIEAFENFGFGICGLDVTPDLGKVFVVYLRDDTACALGGDFVELSCAAAGDSPTMVTIVETAQAPPATVSFFLPKQLRVKLKGEGKDSLFSVGSYDDGGLDVDYAKPVTLRIGDFEQTFTLTPQGKSGSKFRFQGPSLNMAITPAIKGSSRGKFKLKIKNATLADKIDIDSDVALSFSGDGLPAAEGNVLLTDGIFRLNKKRGNITSPAFFPAKAKIKASDKKPVAVTLKGGFATGDATPAQLTTVRFALGELSLSVPGTEFTRSGDVWSYKTKTDGLVSIGFDFLKGVAVIKLKGRDVGPIGETVDALLDVGDGSGPVVVRLRFGQKGSTYSY